MNHRQVNLEFLRAGPTHNQLLSPLTQYLAICGESAACVVNVPYEHGSFLRRLEDLRYDGDNAEQRRLDVLQQTGIDIARLLGSIPGLQGSLIGDPQTLIHLRITMSASELSLLPFELSKFPNGREHPGDTWLALQNRTALCITRRIRSVSCDNVKWSFPPKILFVTGDTREIPFEAHEKALREAIKPWESRNGRNRIHLEVLEDATIEKVTEICRKEHFTHIHILAHGDLQSNDQEKYGICLGGKVIPGQQFVSAIATLDEQGGHRPTVITVASCDSGQVGSVITRGASFAHDLHQAGIPLVVASQFPLSKDASIEMASTLYRDLLLGGNPLIALHKLRTRLHALHSANYHDWVSLVVYEAFPPDLEEQLQEFHYQQTRSAVDAALSQLDAALDDPLNRDELVRQKLVKTAEEARQRLPSDGPFGTECLALRASSAKRLADAEFRAMQLTNEDPAQRLRHLAKCHEYLEQSATLYTAASRQILVGIGTQVHRKATLHWVVVQKLSVETVLGKKLSDEYWKMAKLNASLYLNHADAEERGWAHGSLAELWLLRLASTKPELDDDAREKIAKKALDHAEQIVSIFPDRARFPVVSTWRQFQRFGSWWGSPEFDQILRQFSPLADESNARERVWKVKNGLLETAAAMCERLKPRGTEVDAPCADKKATIDAPPPSRGQTVVPRPAPPEPPQLLAGPRDETAYFSIEMLPARNGDCLWIEIGDPQDPTRVLIDCGVQAAYPSLRQRIDQLPEAQRRIDLFVLSHIDSDHIGGAIPFLKNSDPRMVKEVWFNGWQQISSEFLGAKQGEIFSTLLRDGGYNWNSRTGGKAIVTDGESLPSWNVGDLKLTLLSPTQERLAALARVWDKEIKKLGLTPGSDVEFRRFLRAETTTSTDVDVLADARFKPDRGEPNGSSIALLAEYKGKAALLAADAHAPVLVNSIRQLLRQRGEDKLKVDALKLPHHGSTKNLNIELLNLLHFPSQPKYLVSSDGSTFHHPDREAIARVIKYGGTKPALFFNYSSEFNDVWADEALRKRYQYEVVYPKPHEEGLRVLL